MGLFINLIGPIQDRTLTLLTLMDWCEWVLILRSFLLLLVWKLALTCSRMNFSLLVENLFLLVAEFPFLFANPIL